MKAYRIPAPQSPTADVHRFFVSTENRHFYTATQSEKDIIISRMSDFVYEGVAYSAYGVDDYLWVQSQLFDILTR